MIEFKLPSLGSDMDQGKLLEWRVAPGQSVTKGDILAVVDTSKAAIDIECWVDGTVHRLISRIGDVIAVGTVMAELLAPGETAPALQSDTAAAPRPAPAAAPVSVSTEILPGVAVASTLRAAPAATRQRVSPVARLRAQELGVNLAHLEGSGTDQAITLADVERASAAPTPGPATVIDRNTAMRSAIAAAMSRSKREIPHYYLAESVPMRSALDWTRTHNAAVPVTERLLTAALLLKAVALALRDAPGLNGHFRNGVFAPSRAVHIGVAIWLRQGGLIAPALHDVDDKSLPRLMQELAELVQRARAGSLRSSELSDATITVTNLGDQGAQSVFGVIYPPQVALVGFGRICEQAWVEDGRIVTMPMLHASLAADHRVSDGHSGAVFLTRLRDRLQQPSTL